MTQPLVWLPSPWGQQGSWATPGDTRGTCNHCSACKANRWRQGNRNHPRHAEEVSYGYCCHGNMFFCWLDLNNLWLLGCSMLPARLGWIPRHSPCCWNANTLSSGHLQAGPGASQTWTAWALLWTPWSLWLGFKEKRKESGGRGKDILY